VRARARHLPQLGAAAVSVRGRDPHLIVRQIRFRVRVRVRVRIRVRVRVRVRIRVRVRVRLHLIVRQVVEHLEREHEPRAGQRLLERLGWGQG